jgi:hypothetical protein
MGRKKVLEQNKIKRLDVYIRSEKINLIQENKLMPEIIKSIDEIIKNQRLTKSLV